MYYIHSGMECVKTTTIATTNYSYYCYFSYYYYYYHIFHCYYHHHLDTTMSVQTHLPPKHGFVFETFVQTVLYI